MALRRCHIMRHSKRSFGVGRAQAEHGHEGHQESAGEWPGLGVEPERSLDVCGQLSARDLDHLHP